MNNPWWLVNTLAVSCWFFKMYEPGATMVFGGISIVFGIFVVALVALIFVTRGVGVGIEFNLTRIGMFLIGCAIGSTVLGVGFLLIRRVVAASLTGQVPR